MILFQLLHESNTGGGEAAQDSGVRGKKRGGKSRGGFFFFKHFFLYGSANIPEPARGEIFNKGLESSFCSLSVGLQTFRVACCSLLGAAGEELFNVKPWVEADFLTHFLVSNLIAGYFHADVGVVASVLRLYAQQKMRGKLKFSMFLSLYRGTSGINMCFFFLWPCVECDH